MKRIVSALLLSILLASGFAEGQTLQVNPQNFYVTAAGANTAVVTILGIAGARVRLYSVSVWCGGVAPNIAPALRIDDNAVTFYFDLPGIVYTNQDHPVNRHSWYPALAMPVGGTVRITGNIGNACTQGTFMSIQADQF